MNEQNKTFEENINEELATEEAWRIFHKLVCEAEYVKEEINRISNAKGNDREVKTS